MIDLLSTLISPELIEALLFNVCFRIILLSVWLIYVLKGIRFNLWLLLLNFGVSAKIIDKKRSSNSQWPMPSEHFGMLNFVFKEIGFWDNILLINMLKWLQYFLNIFLGKKYCWVSYNFGQLTVLILFHIISQYKILR